MGTPLTCNFVKLVDVPEMDYYAKDDKGEVGGDKHSHLKGVELHQRD